jgi:hypothetical protein
MPVTIYLTDTDQFKSAPIVIFIFIPTAGRNLLPLISSNPNLLQLFSTPLLYVNPNQPPAGEKS